MSNIQIDFLIEWNEELKVGVELKLKKNSVIVGPIIFSDQIYAHPCIVEGRTLSSLPLRPVQRKSQQAAYGKPVPTP